MSSMDKKGKARGLGRGLSALMADVTSDVERDGDSTPGPADTLVPIERIVPNPDQPRRRFAQEDLDDLTASIREKGIIQPLIVRERGPDQYEIVAGERRWRAAQAAQVHMIPVLIRDLDDAEVLEIAIIENVQRADLNPVEEAVGYRQLMDVYGHTQEKLAAVLGKSRSHIANLLRLLSLPEDVQAFLREGKLSAGHARALITSERPSLLAKKVIAEDLSVRATEALAKASASGATLPTRRKAPSDDKDADTKALEKDLSAALGMPVQLQHRPGQEAGQMVIGYRTLDDLDTLCQKLSEG
jgi:ParB family chromosome partitioning protein